MVQARLIPGSRKGPCEGRGPSALALEDIPHDGSFLLDKLQLRKFLLSKGQENGREGEKPLQLQKTPALFCKIILLINAS